MPADNYFTEGWVADATELLTAFNAFLAQAGWVLIDDTIVAPLPTYVWRSRLSTYIDQATIALELNAPAIVIYGFPGASDPDHWQYSVAVAAQNAVVGGRTLGAAITPTGRTYYMFFADAYRAFIILYDVIGWKDAHLGFVDPTLDPVDDPYPFLVHGGLPTAAVWEAAATCGQMFGPGTNNPQNYSAQQTRWDGVATEIQALQPNYRGGPKLAVIQPHLACAVGGDEEIRGTVRGLYRVQARTPNSETTINGQQYRIVGDYAYGPKV